jgi:sugar phosphate isomerase/epimerase
VTLPARTRTGGFPIGVRRGWGAWQRDLPAFLAWLRAERFAHVDFGNDGDRCIEAADTAGLAIGTIDLPQWKELLSPDAGRRREAVDAVCAHVARCATGGVRTFMTLMLPEDPACARKDNYARMIESYGPIAQALESHGARVGIEGWPGPGALCGSPETLRALFAEIPSPAIGINFDPSHLVRQRIDPVRFLEEFAERVVHVHAKDAEWRSERVYEFGIEQPSAFSAASGFGGHLWRYTLPGHGEVQWADLMRRLQSHGWTGRVSIELEDENFNGSDDGEQQGFRLARDFLEGC